MHTTDKCYQIKHLYLNLINLLHSINLDSLDFSVLSWEFFTVTLPSYNIISDPSKNRHPF